MAQPFRNRKKAEMFVWPMLEFQGRKGTATGALTTEISANNSFSDDVRTLCKQGHLKEALQILRLMDDQGVSVDFSTYVSLLQGCISGKTLPDGKLVHAHIIQTGFRCQDIFLGNTLLNMYTKCGSLGNALRVLHEMPKRNVVSWTVMIAAYAKRGCFEEALSLFYQMQRSGIQPNHFTFASVLPACANLATFEHGKEIHEEIIRCGFESDVFVGSALVDMYIKCGSIKDARNLFDKMPDRNIVSWTAMIAGYAQNGHLDEAWKLFGQMPERNVFSWNAHSNIELGEWVAECLFELDPKNSAPYVVLSNIYAAAGRWDGIKKVRKMMKDRMVEKKPGCSWIEVNKQVHAFLVGDRSHPQMQKIYAKLEKLHGQMKVAGYVPDMRFVLNDVEEEQKEQILHHHSEKLAIGFGLISTSPGTAIRIIKNLRVCSDCHSAIKFISKIVARDIVLRDVNRYHHFKNGQCSCGGYW